MAIGIDPNEVWRDRTKPQYEFDVNSGRSAAYELNQKGLGRGDSPMPPPGPAPRQPYYWDASGGNLGNVWANPGKPTANLPPPGRRVSIADFGKETPMTTIQGQPMRQADANRIGYNVEATRPLIQQQQQGIAAERARQQAALDAQDAALRSTQPGGANYVGTPDRPEAPPISKYQQEAVDRITRQLGQLGSMQERMGDYFSPENRQLMQDLEAARLDIFNRPGNDTPLDQIRGLMDRAGTVLGETVEAGKQKLGEALNTGREAVADGVQATADAVKPNQPDVAMNDTPGAKPMDTADSRTPGVLERLGNRLRRSGERTVDLAAGTPASDARATLRQRQAQMRQQAKDDAALVKDLNKMSPAEAKAFREANPDLPEYLGQLLDARAAGTKVNSANGVPQPDKPGITRRAAKATLRAGGIGGAIPGLIAGVGALGRNISEDGVAGGLRKTGAELVEGVKDTYAKAAETAATLPWDETLKQGAVALGEDVLGGLSAAGKTLGAAGAYVAENATGFRKPFSEIYDEMQAQPDALGLDQMAAGLKKYRDDQLKAAQNQPALPMAEPAKAEPPAGLRSAPAAMRRDLGQRPADLADQYLAQANDGTFGQRQPFLSNGAGGQWVGLGGEAKQSLDAEGKPITVNGRPWTTADSDRLIQAQLAERNTPEAQINDAIERARVNIQNGNITPEQGADLIKSIGGVRGNQAYTKMMSQGLQAARLANTMDTQATEQANKLLADALSTDPENVDAKRAALGQLVAFGKGNPITRQVFNTMMSRGYKNQGMLDTWFSGGPNPWDNLMGRGPKTTPYSLGPEAINQAYQDAPWWAPNGPALPGMGVGPEWGDLSPEEQDFLKAMTTGNQPPGEGQKSPAMSDPQAQAGPSPEELAAMVQAQQDRDRANRQRPALRRQLYGQMVA